MKKTEKLTTLEWCIVGVVFFAAALILLAVLLPPPGMVDESVRECLWILLAFDGVLAVVFAIHKGLDTKITHGETSLELNNPDSNEKE